MAQLQRCNLGCVLPNFREERVSVKAAVLDLLHKQRLPGSSHPSCSIEENIDDNQSRCSPITGVGRIWDIQKGDEDRHDDCHDYGGVQHKTTSSYRVDHEDCWKCAKEENGVEDGSEDSAHIRIETVLSEDNGGIVCRDLASITDFTARRVVSKHS